MTILWQIRILFLFVFSLNYQLFSENQSKKTNSEIVSLESWPAPVNEIQRTFSMIKPRAVQEAHTGNILAKIEEAGFRIVALRMRTISPDEAKRFYAEHASKPFFAELTQTLSSGPIVTIVLEKADAVTALRQLVGATDPKKAAPGTVRHEFGRSITDNAIHASDGPASAEREISFFFSEDEIQNS